MFFIKFRSDVLDSSGNFIEGSINNIDEVKRVFGKTVCTRFNSPCPSISKSWIIPDNFILSIDEVYND